MSKHNEQGDVLFSRKVKKTFIRCLCKWMEKEQETSKAN